jgi:hypothetical protein
VTWFRGRLQYPLGPKYAIKVAIAAGLATLVVQLFHMTYPFFAPLSAIIVMDTTGIAFRLGAATRQMAVVAAVIVMAPVGTDLAHYATARIVETAVGSTAALLVSRFVWPPHIAADTRAAFATLYDHLLDLYDTVVAAHSGPTDRDRIERLDETIQADTREMLEDCVTELLVAAGAVDDGLSRAGAGSSAVLAEFTYLFMLREIATRLVDLAEPHPVASRADTAPATPNP